MNSINSKNSLNRSADRDYLFFFVEIILFFVNLFYYLHIDKTNVTVTDLQVLTIMNVILCIVIFAYCLFGRNIQKNIGLLCFSISYFVLIVGQYFTALFDDSIYGKYIFTTVSSISYRSEAVGLFVIFVALFCVSIGYLSKHSSVKHAEKSGLNNDISAVCGRYSLIIMYLGGVAAFAKLFLKIYYVVQNGYWALYLNTGDALFTSPLLDLFDGFYMIGFIGFIASFPDMKELKKPLALYIVYSVLSLLTGQRGELVINIMFIIWYISKRSDIRNKKIFLTRKKMIIIGILSVLLMSFLYTWGYSRVGVSVSSESFGEKISNFIYNQGGSGHLISLSVEKIDLMEKYISKSSMVMWPLESYMKNNAIIRIFTGGSLGQSSTNIGSFGAALTYITNRSSYLKGAAVGTCYVAELYCAFGFFGVAVFNVLLGRFLKKMDCYIISDNWKNNTLFLKIFWIMLYLPRQPALQFIPECVNVVAFVIIVSVLCGGKRGKQVARK